MFGSGILDSIIGLVFVFLLVSMLVTILNEMIAAALMSRAKWLRIGIERLIGADWMKKVYAHPLIEGTSRKADAVLAGRDGPSYIPSRSFANVLMSTVQQNSPAVAACERVLRQALDAATGPGVAPDGVRARLSEAAAQMREAGGIGAAVAADLMRRLDGHAHARGGAPAQAGAPQAPSQLPCTIADAYVDIRAVIDGISSRYLRQVLEDLPDERVRAVLLTLFDDAADDVDKLKEHIEVWFNNGMDRVNGWYKRRAQLVIACLSLATAVAMNVDAIGIFRHLQTYPTVREALVAQAKGFVEAAPAGGTKAMDPDALPREFDAIQEKVASLSIPIGWDAKDAASLDLVGGQIRAHWLGWLLTALAASLGAPFWFDTLNRIISIRSSGKAPEEEPKPPKTVSVPVEPGQSPQEADRARQSTPRGR